ncbi:MAG: hypothetical protein ACI87N_000358 [Flavobacteriales bacterium]|jgi:hypothetical protein
MENINNKRFLLVLSIALLMIYFGAGIFFDPSYVVYIKPLIIPTFMVYVVNTSRKKLSFNYLLFVVLFYANETLILFWEDSVPLFWTALVCSFFSYFALINLGYKAIKSKALFAVPKGFSLFILVLNCIFLVAVLYILTTAVNDYILNIIIIFNATIAVFLGATAVTYLGKFGDSKAYFYFFGAFALIFNDIFAAIGIYFVENIVLNAIDRVLHFIAFYFIYLFILRVPKKADNLEIDYQP